MEDSISSAPKHQLEKRNDYAMDCGDGNGPKTKRCSGAPYKYYSKKNGYLDTRGRGSAYYEDRCHCLETFFKSCPAAGHRLVKRGFSFAEVVDPAGTIGNFTQTAALPNGSLSNNNGTSNSQQRRVYDVSPLLSPRVGLIRGRPNLPLLAGRISRSWPAASRTSEIHCSACRITQQFSVSDRKFGFHMKTIAGPIVQHHDGWSDSWEEIFSNFPGHLLDLDGEKNPPWPEFEHIKRLTKTIVIPPLLRPLQSDGRNIKPCLVHGGLWDGNTATDLETGEPFILTGRHFMPTMNMRLGIGELHGIDSVVKLTSGNTSEIFQSLSQVWKFETNSNSVADINTGGLRRSQPPLL